MIIHFAQQHVIPSGQEDFFPACSEAGLLMPKKQSPQLRRFKMVQCTSANQWQYLLCLNEPF
jgi:hypothetical protein